MDLQEIQKLETSLFKLRRSEGERWDFKLLNWSQERGTLSLDFSKASGDEHLVVAVNKNKGGPVATGKIFIKIQENINLGAGYASILFYDGPTVALITEGKPFRPSSFLGYCSAFFQGVNYDLSQVNYHVLNGTLCLSLAGAVRSPTTDGKFFIWRFSQAEIDVEKSNRSSQCRCIVKKVKGVEPNAHVHYRFTIPGAYMGFDNKGAQYFISGRGILLAHGELSDFSDQSKCFAAPAGMLDSLSAYLTKNCPFTRVWAWLFRGGEDPTPSNWVKSSVSSARSAPPANCEPVKMHTEPLVHPSCGKKLSSGSTSGPVSHVSDPSTITHYFRTVRK